jgi:hypothetical protein
MFPRFKPLKSHVPHNGCGIIGHAEQLDEMKMSGFKTEMVHPVHLTPPHPARLRKRF